MKQTISSLAILCIFAFAAGCEQEKPLRAITNCPDGGVSSKEVGNGGIVEFCDDKDCFILFIAEGGKTYTYTFNPADGGQTEWALDEPMHQDVNSDGDRTGTGSKKYDVHKAGTLTFIAKDEDGKEVGRMKITIKKKKC